MKAMIWKELRENFKWAILAMIGLGLAEFYGINYYDPSNYNNRGVTLCNPTFLMATSFGCAIVGLLLGFVQILPEQRRDQWAALLHRPVSRATIFRGKAVAGIVLYLLATVVPFLACVWMAATPGHFVAPFVPSLVLPGVADIGTGLVYYFAALLLALQRGSWFGARVFALLAAVYLSFFVTSINYFHLAMEASVLMALVLFTAGWGAILGNGSFRVRPWLGKAALLAAVFYGLCGLGSLIHIIARGGGQPYSNIGSRYGITAEGLPIITTINKDLSKKVTDLDGHIITDERYTGAQSYQNLQETSEICSVVGDSHGYDPVQRYYDYRQSGRLVGELEMGYGLPLPVKWFYLIKQRYFIGISTLTKQPVGIVDRTGFKPAGAIPEPFTQVDGFVNTYIYYLPCLVRSGNTAFVFDFEHNQTFQLPGTDVGLVSGVESAGYRTSITDSSDYKYVIAVALPHELRVYDLKGAPLVTLPYHRDTDRFGNVSLGITKDRGSYFVKYEPSLWISEQERRHMPSFLQEVDSQGNIVHSYDLPPLPIYWGPRSWFDYLYDSAETPAFWYGNLVYQKVGGLLGIQSLADDDQDAFHSGWGHTKEKSIRITLYSLFFAVIALGWARWARFSWRSAWAWAAFALAFNIAGLIAFRLVADWPVRVKCPQCSRKRPVEETTCPHCQTLWPSPKLDGIEIFEQKNPVAETVS